MQQVDDLKVRVFRWNEELPVVYNSHGFFLFRIMKSATRNTTQDGRFFVAAFELQALSARASTEDLVSQAVEIVPHFAKNTKAILKKDLPLCLLSCFKFDLQKEEEENPSTRKPFIVVVTDVYLSKGKMPASKRDFPEALRTENKDGSKEYHSIGSSAKRRRTVPEIMAAPVDCEKGEGKLVSTAEVEVIHSVLLSLVQKPCRCGRSELEKVEEPLGLSEVEAAVEVKPFDAREEEEEEEACSICLQGIFVGMTVAATPCSHMFHKNCLFAWLPATGSCPMCRGPCATLISS